jgi:hypothetical protein
LVTISVNIGVFLDREGDSIVWLSWIGSGYSLLTYYTYTEAVLYGLACYYPILGSNYRLLSSKAISTLSSKKAVGLLLVRGNRTSLSTIGINRTVYSIWLSDRGDWNPLPICYIGIDGRGAGSILYSKEKTNIV